MPFNPILSLDPLKINLSGINLIEASAGTGKTYTIATLFVRLVLEKNLDVDRLLVVTFTEAATAELRDRIRQRLRETLNAFQGQAICDTTLQELLTDYAEPENKNRAIKLLERALRSFDQAVIHTIHGFCSQLLKNFAFESGILFDSQLTQEKSILLQAIAEDFWRQNIYKNNALFIDYLLTQGYESPYHFLAELEGERYVNQPFLTVIPKIENSLSYEPEQQTFIDLYQKTKETWQESKKEIEKLLLDSKSLNGNKYRKKSIPVWCQALDMFLSSSLMTVTLPEKFEKFTTATLQESVKKGEISPKHNFFELCEALQQTQHTLIKKFEQQLLYLKLQLLNYIEIQLKRRKHQNNTHDFDDLLLNVFNALKNPAHGQKFAALVRQRYPVALIDEFQDTDPIQYDIFRRIYLTKKQKNALFLIGDPKQSIYSFRGADIFTYMKACEDAQFHYTLDKNWRSQASLIQATNALFEQTAHPFIFESIPFHPAQSARSVQEDTDLKIENTLPAPLNIWFISKHPQQDKLTKEGGRQAIYHAIGQEIIHLLTSNTYVGKQRITAGDIAILVRTNRQSRELQNTLTHLQIPSVLYSRESVFLSQEAEELERILLAIAEPNHDTVVKAALTTDMLGMSATILYELASHVHQWQRYLNRFQHYHILWQKRGFIFMFRKMLHNEMIAERVLAYHDGERRLTNVLHLSELLQQAETEQKLGLTGLCTWFSNQLVSFKARSSGDSEEQQLRLESDEKRVKIVTIHKSKGLEYPIVFCPTLWDAKTKKSKTCVFHDENSSLILDLGSENQETHLNKALEEEKAENLRLFYVAVTRAKHRCYLAWGGFNNAEHSPLGYLLYPNTSIDIAKSDNATLLKPLQHLTDYSEQTIAIEHLPQDQRVYQRPVEENVNLHPRQFHGDIKRQWQMTSFTALVSSSELHEQPDHDEKLIEWSFREKSTQHKKIDIFQFPGGARTGNFMHSLFETMDFTKPSEEDVTKHLRNYGYNVEKWQTVIMNMVVNVLTTQLLPSMSFTLADIHRQFRLNELEFYYALNKLITVQELQTIFANYGYENVQLQEMAKKLTFSPLQGMMKGYIDMVFCYQNKYYLVDYKSNLLGETLADYSQSHIEHAMQKELYILQYHIYTVALHRYLRYRLKNYDYAQHFGGVLYLFLRGMQPDIGPDYGIYYDLPSQRLVENLSAYFSEKVET